MNLKKIVLATVLLLMPGFAFAFGGGGGIIGAIIGVVGVVLAPFTGGLSLGMTIAAVAGAAAVGYMLGSTLEMMINPPSFDMPDVSYGAAESQNAGVSFNKQGTNLNIPVVYGQRRLGGTRVFVSTNGKENKFLYIALTLCEGEINSIKNIYIDDTLVWSGSTVHGTRYTANTGGKFKDYFTFESFHGTTAQTASTLLKEASGWGDDKKLTGIAYLACKCEWPQITSNEDAKANPWQGLPNIVVELQGKKVYYPSNLAVSYSGLTYTQRKNFTNYFTTYGYSDHPVDCFLDYLRAEIYGKGLSDTQIDWHSFYKERIRWSKDQNGLVLGSDRQHLCNAIVFTDRTVMDNVKTFLLNMRSSLVYQDGEYRLVVVDNGNTSSIYGTASSIALTINEDDIIDGIKVDAESAENKFNRLIVSYMGALDGTGQKTYEPAEYTYPVPDSALESQYLAEDNNRVVEHRITLEHVTSATTAGKMAEIILERSRKKGKTISFQGTSRMYQLEVGDVVAFEYDSLSISGKFRVKNVVQNVDFTFYISLEEHDDVAYAYNPTPRTVKQYKQYQLGTDNPGPGYPVNGEIVYPGPINNFPRVKPPDGYTPNPDQPPYGSPNPNDPPVPYAPPPAPPYFLIDSAKTRYVGSTSKRSAYAEIWFKFPFQTACLNFYSFELHFQSMNTTQPNYWSLATYGPINATTSANWRDPLSAYKLELNPNVGTRYRMTFYDGFSNTPKVYWYINYLSPSSTALNGKVF